MTLFLFAATAVAVVVGIYDYFFLERTASFWNLPVKGKKGKWLLRLLAAVIAAPVANLFGLWAVIILYATGFMVLLDLVQWILQRTVGSRKWWDVLYGCGLLPVLATVLVMGYAFWNMGNVRKTEYTVHTKKEIRKEGYRIALLSDLHFPTTMDEGKLQEYCAEISAENPDVAVLCGDIVDEHTSKEEMEATFEILSGIQARFGIYYVFGNHDCARYADYPPFTEEELSQAITGNGIHILEDEAVALNGEFIVVGRDDRSKAARNGRKASQDLLLGVDMDDFLLLLDHQPVGLKDNEKAGYDLQLSGHTHAGQMWPVGPFTTIFHLTELNYGYRKQGDFQAIVTSGIAGWGYAFRTGKHAEYVMIDVLHI